MERPYHFRFHIQTGHFGTPFGPGRFGQFAEATARFFGTPFYLVGQSLLVMVWVAANAAHFLGFDPYPFILLNLAFSLQAAYAAPLILLAQTRQAERDKLWTEADAKHREDIAATTLSLLEQNTELTREVKALSERVQLLTNQIHDAVVPA